MEFTYNSYGKLIRLLQDKGYLIVNYNNHIISERCAILRHDVDNSLEKACKMAEIEKELNVSSTYFIMLSNSFYNVFSKKGTQSLRHILECGHEIGLHFDEKVYPEFFGKIDEIKDKILTESSILSYATGRKVRSVSMHRPSKEMLNADLQIDEMINSYSKLFYKEFKYVSDSRRRWREPIEELVAFRDINKFQILTHPFWYNEKEYDIKRSVSVFVNSAILERYDSMADNITDMRAIMEKPQSVS